ncbi:MAG: VWA domain-containing protein [Acidobacteria bacterium]|nr:VWA domain-containing protein [Acidobacteriota bacterium]
MLRKHLFKTAFSFFALIAAASAAMAQSPSATPPVDDDEPIRIDSRLIVVPVSVVDANGQPVTGLTQADFQISEEGRRQQIESVGSADSVPLDIALLFDVSASTDAMFRFQQETAVKFLKDVLRAEDRAAIFTIGEKALLVSGLAQAGPATESVLAIPVERAKQPTAFFDSVRAAADYLRENSQSGRRRVIVVISDGEDNFSVGVQRAQRTAERRVVDNRPDPDLKRLGQIIQQAQQAAKVAERQKVLRALQDADTVMYAVNPAGSSYRLNQISVFGQENMQIFSDETGGTAFLPNFGPIDTNDNYLNGNNRRKNTELLERIFRQLGNELRAQYLIQYYSDATYPDGKLVKLSVGLTRPAARVRARQGYYVRN